MYSVVFSFGGIPLLYMGDELALRNDPRYRDDPAHRHDNRWLHRPAMDWAAAGQRTDPATVPGRAYTAVRGLVAARIGQPALSAAAPTRVLRGGDPALLTYLRGTPGHRPVLAAVNVSATPRSIDVSAINAAGIGNPVHIHSTTGTLNVVDGHFDLPGCGFLWVGDAFRRP